MLSEKATSERIKKRGLHHPLTRDSILLRVSAIQRAQCVDEVSTNMEHNARLRDSWGSHTPHADLQSLKQSLHICPLWRSHVDHRRRAKTCVPLSKTAASQTVTNTLRERHVTTAPDTSRRHHPCLCSAKAQPQNVAAHTAVTRIGTFSTGAKERPRAPKIMLTRTLPYSEYCIKTSTSLPRINTFGPIQRAGGDTGWSQKRSWKKVSKPRGTHTEQRTKQEGARGIRGCFDRI